MSGLFDSHPLEFDCPRCSGKVRTTVGEARRNPTLRCANGHEIEVDASQFDSELREADRAVEDLKRSIERFGR